MTTDEAKLAGEMVEALENMPDVRKGMLSQSREGGKLCLEIGIFEGDYNGGSGRGNALLPIALAEEVVSFAENLMLLKLHNLGVTVAGHPLITKTDLPPLERAFLLEIFMPAECTDPIAEYLSTLSHGFSVGERRADGRVIYSRLREMMIANCKWKTDKK